MWGRGSGGDEGKFSAAAAAAAAHSHEKLQTSPSPSYVLSPRVCAYKPKQTSVSPKHSLLKQGMHCSGYVGLSTGRICCSFSTACFFPYNAK